MPATDSLSVGWAFLAGFLSFLSPCVLPLVPIYIGYLSGTTVTEQGVSRLRTVSHAGAFVAGFSIVFVIVGLMIGLAGSLVAAQIGLLGVLEQLRPYLVKLGGAVLIVLGLQLAGLVRIPFLYREWRLESNAPQRRGLLASLVVGMTFALGWTPCVGTYLSSIFLLLAVDSSSVGRCAGLLAVYSLGLGLPFLLAGFALQAVSAQLRRLNRYLNVVSIVGGSLLIIMGLLLITNNFQRLNAILGSLW